MDESGVAQRARVSPRLAVWWLAACLTPAIASAQSAIPTPRSVLGFDVGDDFRLADYDESLRYFRQLDAASERLQLIEIGRTSNGRSWYMALISSPENLHQIERHRQTAQRIAHPETLSDQQARALSRQGRAFVHIDGGLHASEVAGAQHTIELAHRLLRDADDPKIANVLDHVVLLLWPSLNPDGQNLVVDWYRSNLGTPYEVAPLVELYQKYIGHDNNRDAYMLNMVESRVVARTWRHWEPQVIYVHHQSSPFPTRIWLPPFAEPIARHAPPLLSREVNTIGMLIAQALEENGQPGATHMGTGFDAWYPGYIDYLPMFQNIAAFWTETGLYRFATPRFYTIDDFPESRRDLRSESLYPSPWQGGWWRLSDAVEYMLTASVAVLDYAAKYREQLLYNRYRAGRDTIEKYRHQPPYAYFVPRRQRDPVAAAELVRRLAFNGLRIYELTAEATLEGQALEPGTWVVPMDQEFAELARELLDLQDYPDLREYPQGPPEQPYDAAGWTLGLQMGVRVVAAATPLGEELGSRLRPVEGAATDWQDHRAAATAEGVADRSLFDSVPGLGFDSHGVAAGVRPLPGEISGSGAALLLDPAENNAFRVIGRALARGDEVRFDRERGRYSISGSLAADAVQLAEQLALRIERQPRAAGERVRARVGLYRPWYASMDEGWTRWLLERYEIRFENLDNGNFFAGELGERFDVIVLTDERPGMLFEGYRQGTVPPRYAGGLGERGVRALDRFVRRGGTLVCFNRSTPFAIEQLVLPVVNVVADLPRDELFLAGSLLEVEVNTRHPVMAGMPARASVFVDRSPVFGAAEGFEGSALAKYADHGSPLLSGYLLGEEHLRGFAAALDVHHGEGRVVLLGFRPQWRGQPFGTFRVLFNSALFGGDLAATTGTNPEFWTSPPLPEADAQEDETSPD